MNDHRNAVAPTDSHASDKLIVLPWFEPRKSVERRAREYKRTHDIGYNQALDRIARENEFPNWRTAVSHAYVEGDVPHLFTYTALDGRLFVILLGGSDVRQDFLERNELEDFSEVDWSNPAGYDIQRAYGTNVVRDVGQTTISQVFGWNDAFTMAELSTQQLADSDSEEVAFFQALRTPAALTAFRLKLAATAPVWMVLEWITDTPAYLWAQLNQDFGPLTPRWQTRYGTGNEGTVIQAFDAGTPDTVLVVESNDTEVAHRELSTSAWESLMAQLCVYLNDCSEAEAEHDFNAFGYLHPRLFVDPLWGGLAIDA